MNNHHHENHSNDHEHSHNDHDDHRKSDVFYEGQAEDDTKYYQDINLEEKFNQLGDEYDQSGMPKEIPKNDEFTNEIIYYELMKLHSQAKEEGLEIEGDSDKLIEEQYFKHLEEAGPIQDPKSNNLLLLKEMMSKRQQN